MTKACPTCGKRYSPDLSFCLDDGTALLPAMPSAAAVIEPTVGSNGSPLTLIAVAAVVLAVVVVGVALYYIAYRGPEAKYETISAEQKPAPSPNDRPVNGNTNAAGPGMINTPRPAQMPVGRWAGDWSSPSGAYLTIVVTLNDSGDGQLDGTIVWTLRRTTRPEKMSKIGMSATEYVRGNFDTSSSIVTLHGYRKDDPNDVLVMVDDYRLTLSADGSHLNGSARNGGKWDGKVVLSR